MKREKSDGTAAGKRVNMQKPEASICKEIVLSNVLHIDARRSRPVNMASGWTFSRMASPASGAPAPAWPIDTGWERAMTRRRSDAYSLQGSSAAPMAVTVCLRLSCPGTSGRTVLAETGSGGSAGRRCYSSDGRYGPGDGQHRPDHCDSALAIGKLAIPTGMRLDDAQLAAGQWTSLIISPPFFS